MMSSIAKDFRAGRIVRDRVSTNWLADQSRLVLIHEILVQSPVFGKPLNTGAFTIYIFRTGIMMPWAHEPACGSNARLSCVSRLEMGHAED
jgi:hypothetical protein